MQLVVCKFCGRLEQESSGGHTLRGLYERITASQYPCPMPPLHVAIQLEAEIGDAPGQVPLVAFLQDEDGRIVAEIESEVEVKPVRSGIPSRGWVSLTFHSDEPIPKPGLYRCEVTIAGHILGGERLEFAAPVR